MYPMTDRQQADFKIDTFRREAREHSLYRLNRNPAGGLRHRAAEILRRAADRLDDATRRGSPRTA